MSELFHARFRNNTYCDVLQRYYVTKKVVSVHGALDRKCSPIALALVTCAAKSHTFLRSLSSYYMVYLYVLIAPLFY